MESIRRFVIGDIHGANAALTQCFERSGFNIHTDLLICLGDYCDRWPEVNKVFDTLLTVKNKVLLLGNHDQWAMDWFLYNKAPEIWLIQGGEITVNAYPEGVPENHINLLKQAVLFHQLDNKLFVHGGYDPRRDIRIQDRHLLLWDRSLIKAALENKNKKDEIHLTPYDEVYVGHTPTLNFGESIPIKACEVYLMDTGAGWPGGVLTMMDVDSKEYFQSDLVDQLYGDFISRM